MSGPPAALCSCLRCLWALECEAPRPARSCRPARGHQAGLVAPLVWFVERGFAKYACAIHRWSHASRILKRLCTMHTFPHLASRSHSAPSLLHGDHDSRFQRTPAKNAHGEKAPYSATTRRWSLNLYTKDFALAQSAKKTAENIDSAASAECCRCALQLQPVVARAADPSVMPPSALDVCTEPNMHVILAARQHISRAEILFCASCPCTSRQKHGRTVVSRCGMFCKIFPPCAARRLPCRVTCGDRTAAVGMRRRLFGPTLHPGLRAN